jgi:hypothetical protein
VAAAFGAVYACDERGVRFVRLMSGEGGFESWFCLI